LEKNALEQGSQSRDPRQDRRGVTWSWIGGCNTDRKKNVGWDNAWTLDEMCVL